MLRMLIGQVKIFDSRIEISCDTKVLATMLGVAAAPDAPDTITLPSDIRLTRSGRAMRLVQSNGATATAVPDRSLIRLLIKARTWWAQLREGEVDIKTLASHEGVSAAWVTRVVRLAFLSPAVVEAMLAGKVRAGVDAASLVATDAIAASWVEQEACIIPARS